MTWFLLGAAGLATTLAPQSDAAPVDAVFTLAELQPMCRGETEGAEFRTQSAYALLAQVQRSRCTMYLLGLAEGIGRPERNSAACAATAAERDAFADLLVEAVLRARPESGETLRQIVADALRSRPPCREGGDPRP